MTVSATQLNNNVTIPQLGFGTWKMKGITGEAQRSVAWALEAGYRHIDTARIYLNEKGVGKAIKASGIPREEIFLTTKLWNGDQDKAEAAFEKSLKRLDTGYVDLYLMHFPVTKTRLRAWKDMETIYASGRAKAIGVSNFTIKHLEELLQTAKVVPAVNQVEFHTFLYQSELLEYCRARGIVLEAYSPLAHAKRLDNPVLQAVAAAHDKSIAQIMIRWCLQHDTVVIPKSSTQSRIQENFEVFDFELSSEEMTRLDALNENLRTCWDPSNTP